MLNSQLDLTWQTVALLARHEASQTAFAFTWMQVHPHQASFDSTPSLCYMGPVPIFSAFMPFCLAHIRHVCTPLYDTDNDWQSMPGSS